MPNQIEQSPQFALMPVGQDIIFAVSNANVVALQLKVKFVAEVHISSGTPPNLANNNDLIGTFKTTPNNKGVGMFNLSNVVENYVKADNMAVRPAKYKGVYANDVPFPIHMIDKYCRNSNAVRYLAIQFKIEYLGGDPAYPNVVNTASGHAVNSANYTIFNGYLKDTDALKYGGASNQNFGWDWGANYLLTGSTKKFLTNAPTLQSANLEDYGTVTFIVPQTYDPSYEVGGMELLYLGSDNTIIGLETVNLTWTNGGFTTYTSDAYNQLLYFGCFPANLQNSSSTFQALVSAGTIQGGSISVRATYTGSPKSDWVTIKVNCPDGKGYEPIRLAWLNQFGAWDYFTFNKKSTRSISTKGSTYNQLAGTWNESTYRADSYKGGKKSFRVNATEKIKMNTDFVNEDHNTMFEELINSPEVYILDGFQSDTSTALLNTYVTPVRLTTSSFTRKTVANDKLIQYSFEVEKSKTLRTQSV